LTTLEWALVSWVAIGMGSFLYLLGNPAPYGRHRRKGWGPLVGPRLGWLIMELPSPLTLVLVYLWFEPQLDRISLCFLALWLWHYGYRSLLFPLYLGRARSMPLTIIVSGIGFNLVNGFFHGWHFSHHSYAPDWLGDPRFWCGSALFLLGFITHVWTDRSLVALKRQPGDGYRIPMGGLFRWVSCPNYGGELVQWTGWALATWSLAGLSFSLWTAANLVPRALAHHRWYRSEFQDYPRERRAILPYLL